MVTVCVRDDKFGLWGKEDTYAVHKAVRVEWQRQGSMNIQHGMPWARVGAKEEVATLNLKACHVARQAGSGTLEEQMKNSHV